MYKRFFFPTRQQGVDYDSLNGAKSFAVSALQQAGDPRVVADLDHV